MDRVLYTIGEGKNFSNLSFLLTTRPTEKNKDKNVYPQRKRKLFWSDFFHSFSIAQVLWLKISYIPLNAFILPAGAILKQFYDFHQKKVLSRNFTSLLCTAMVFIRDNSWKCIQNQPVIATTQTRKRESWKLFKVKLLKFSYRICTIFFFVCSK